MCSAVSAIATTGVYAPANYKGLLFDLDETLIDFKIAEKRSLSRVYEDIYTPFAKPDKFLETFHDINKKLWKEFEEGLVPLGTLGRMRFEQLSRELSAEVDIDAVCDLYEKSLGMNAEWLPGAEESLNELKKQYTLGIVTNGFSKVQKIKFDRFSLSTWCECYVVSEEVGSFKPDPKIFSIALAQIRHEPHEVLMIGDSLNSDYKGAMNAGIDFCWVNRHGEKIPDELPAPKYEVSSVAELLSILR